MDTKPSEARRPASIAVIGAGNRANKYLKYVKMNPDKVQLVGIVEVNDIRRNKAAECFSLKPTQCYSDYKDFFRSSIRPDAVLICTPEDMHFEPCMMAIRKGCHVLLEKPIAQTLEECIAISNAAKEKGVLVAVCHVLRHHPYFMKIKQLIASKELGQIISINHRSSVGIDRSTHGFVRGMWRKEEITNPMLISKCCHDIDFLLWLTDSRCHQLTSFGSLRWFRSTNAPQGSAGRCVNCKIERNCPFSAVRLYRERQEWIANFDIPEGKSMADAIEYQLHEGLYGRCVYHCDNNVVDHQIVSMEMENEVTVNFSMDVFTLKDNRETHICLTEGEIQGDETTLHVKRFCNREENVYDFSDIIGTPFHAGADLALMADFIEAVRSGQKEFATSINHSIESHRICYEAERSRKEKRLIIFK